MKKLNVIYWEDSAKFGASISKITESLAQSCHVYPWGGCFNMYIEEQSTYIFSCPVCMVVGIFT
jgi:hypothetical protein